MIKWLIIILPMLGSINSKFFYAQDIGVVAKLAPNSGCQIGNNLTVTVQIFNFGSAFTSPFDVSYKVNGNTPIDETVNLGTFNPSTSYSHTFATNVDLSIPGSYVMKFYTTLGGDVNNANDTLTLTIVNDPYSVGGTLPADFSVCELGNSGNIDLAGYTGNVIDWEITTDGGGSWSSLSNLTDTESYSNLALNSGYRAIVKSGTCPNDTSTVVNITVDPESIGGNVSGPSSICTPPNAASINLAGQQGGIVDWEISTDGGSTWSNLGDNSNPLNQTNLPLTTSYRAEVQSGVCPSEYSDTLEVIVVSNLNGGDLDPLLDSVCITSNGGTLNLLNSIGNIDHWESSNDLISWSTISNTTTTHSFSNLTDTTYYRVIVSACTTDTSTIAEIIVSEASIAGSITTSIDACEGDDINGLVSTGYFGNNFVWESSLDSVSWSTQGNQNSLNIGGVSSSQYVRFITTSGVCSADTSNVLTINVSSAPSFLSFTAPDSLCISSNLDSIVYSGVNESIVDWIYSEDGGSSWNSFSLNDSILNISPAVSTNYGLLVSSGTCPIDTFFNSVHVSESSIAGLIPTDTMICSSLDSVSITNSGALGSMTWYASSTETGPYTSIGSGNSIEFSTSNYLFVYAQVENEVCPSVNSDTTSISFFPSNYGITGDTLVQQYSPATFEAFGGQTYLWNADPTITDLTLASQTVEISEANSYYVTITDTNGCDYLDSITVNLLDEGLQIATIITPNNDGFNDSWVIKFSDDYGPIKVTVTNAFGQVVYSNDQYLSDWDGEYKGGYLPAGAYYYLVEASNGETFYGTLNILTNE